MKIYEFDPKKNKKVLLGELIGDTLFRGVDPKHFMRVVQGYGIQEVAFQTFRGQGVEKIVLKENNSDKRWEADLADWEKIGRVMDYGHGRQRFLSLKHMKPHKTPDLIK